MAKLKAFAVYDAKLSLYNSPMFLQHVGQAERMFEEIVNDEKSMIHKHPTDFELFLVGEFDDEQGTFTSQSQPVLIASATTSRRKPQSEPRSI